MPAPSISDALAMVGPIFQALLPLMSAFLVVNIAVWLLRVLMRAAVGDYAPRVTDRVEAEKSKVQRVWVPGPAELPAGEFTLGDDGELMFHKSDES